MRVNLIARWRGGDLDRLLNARHSAFHEAVAREFARRFPEWTLAPEVSFSVYGERGVIDVLALHAGRRALLVIELKTDVTDVNELVGTFDRKVRLAGQIAADRGWRAATVSGWVIVAPGRTNRVRVATHRAMLRAAFPIDPRRIRGWLQEPRGPMRALSIWPASANLTAPALAPIRRVPRRVASVHATAVGG
jgi:hypothetical protein